MTPIIRWVGGKSRLLPAVHEIIGDRPIRNYFETFFGGGAVYFSLHERIRCEAYLNDSNIPLIETYEQIRTAPNALVAQLKKLADVPYKNIQHEFNLNQVGLLRRAALFLALNHMCFNGLWRVNKLGHMNTPQGSASNKKPRTMANFPYEAIPLGSTALRKATFGACKFEVLAQSPHSSLNKVPGEGDLVIFDPPYLDTFDQYTTDGFGIAGHTLLRMQADRCASVGAMVLLFGSDSDASLEIYGEPSRRVRSKQTVGASKRGEIHESIWVYGK